MANIAVKFVSGLVVGTGAVSAFVSFFNDQTQIANYKLTRASLTLKEVVGSSTEEISPSWKDRKLDVMNKYERLSAHLLNNAVSLAKAEWNSTVSSMANCVLDMGIEKARSVANKDY